MHAFRQERMVSGSYRCYWRACWSYIEVIMFLHLRPLLERAALNRFSFFSKHLHCVKVLLSTALNPELLIVTLELALTITNAVIFNWQISKRKLCFSIHVIQSHSTCKLREIQLRTQTVLVMHRLQYVTFVNIDSWDGKQYVGRGGGRLPSKVLFGEAPPRGSTPYPLHKYTTFHKRHPFRVSFIEKWFHIPA